MKVIISGLIASLVTIPVWIYLLYKILTLVEATELMWFLFYVYVPAQFTVSLISSTLKNEGA